MATYGSFKKIESESIIDGAVTGTTLATDSVTTVEFANASVRTSDIQAGAVGTTQLASTVDLSGKTVTYRPLVSNDFTNGSIDGGKLASGAIVSNLGYTPLNKAGGTHSGSLKIAAGSAGSPSLQSSSSSNTGIFFPASNQVAFTTGGTNQLNINANGHFREPNKPAFHAAGSGGWYYANSFGGVNGWRELTNMTWNVTQQGGNNVGTNGRFYAPVAGYYYFYLQTYWYNDDNNTNGYTHWNIGRNGSPSTSVNGWTPHTIYSHGATSHHTPGIQVGVTFWMNQGDYASPQPYWGGGGTGRMHGDHSLWCGFLIG